MLAGYALRSITRVCWSRPVGAGRGNLFGVIATLAGTISASVAIFAVIFAIQFKPLPLLEPSNLYVIWHSYPGHGIEKERVSPPSLDLYRQFEGAVDNLAAVTPARGVNLALEASGEPGPARQIFVEPALFSVLGTVPSSGRLFVEEDAAPANASNVAVLSSEAWHRYFGAEVPNGQRLLVDGEFVEIVGTLPRDFQLLEEADILRPLYLSPRQRHPSQLGNDYLTVFSRVRRGVSAADLSRSLDELTRQVRNAYPLVYPASEGWHLVAVPLREEIVGTVRETVPLLWASLVVLALIGFVNVMNLVFARTVARRSEFAVKTALGGGWLYLLIDHVAWILSLCVASAGIGVALAHGMLQVTINTVLSEAQRSVPPWSLVDIDIAAIAFGIGLGLLCCLVCALATSGMVLGGSPQRWVTSASRLTMPKGARATLRALVAVELAMATVLLALSGMLVQSVLRISSVDPGFSAEDVRTFRLVLPRARYSNPASRRVLRTELVDRLDTVPGVESAGAISALPFLQPGASAIVRLWGDQSTGSARPLQTSYLAASPGYFGTMRIPLLNGRTFDRTDQDGTQKVVIVDRMAADFYWPDQDPLGNRLAFTFEDGDDGQPEWRTVVGVVGHTKSQTLRTDSDFQIYVPMTQARTFSRSFVVRFAPAADNHGRIVQSVVSALDPQLPLHGFTSMSSIVDESFLPMRASAVVLVVFCATAMLLAMVGTYGVISYLVALSSRELGIRIALGASRGQILAHVLNPVLRLCLISVAVAIPTAMVVSSSMRSLLFEVSPLDPVALIGASLLTSVLAILASTGPALVATAIEPAVTLRPQ